MKIEQVVKLHTAGVPATQIAKKLQVDRRIIYKTIRAAGFKVRDRGRPGIEDHKPKKAAAFRAAYIPGVTIAKASKVARIPYYVGRNLARKDRKMKFVNSIQIA